MDTRERLIETELSAAGTALERINGYLHRERRERREREVLRGCPIGRLTHDPDVMAAPALRAALQQCTVSSRCSIHATSN